MGTTFKKSTAKIAAVLAAALLCLGVAFAFTGCSSSDGASPASSSASEAASSETREFTDDLGRTVELPAQIDRIAPSGSTANQVLLTMAPDKMVGLATDPSEAELKYYGDELADLPVFGSAFGGKGDINREALAAADPQVIIDTGEAKDGLTEDMDTLQEQLGIPVVFVECAIDDYGAAYETLGELLGMEDRGNELAEYCRNAYSEVEEVMASIPEEERANVLYILGEDGTNVLGKGTFQAQVVDMCADNLAVMDNPSNQGQGSETSLEQIALWTPSSSPTAASTTPWPTTPHGTASPPSTTARTTRRPAPPTTGSTTRRP